MDITLERILSLIPTKDNGKFVHGAVKEFAVGLGLKSGNIISDWIAGRSTSYTSYLYQISARYNVSVEWLKGETDQKEKPLTGNDEGLSEVKRNLIDKIRQMDDATIEALNQIADQVLALRGK